MKINLGWRHEMDLKRYKDKNHLKNILLKTWEMIIKLSKFKGHLTWVLILP